MLQFVDKVEFESEDGGKALIATLSSSDDSDDSGGGELFVRLQSWDDNCKHLEAQRFAGKRVRVTITILD